MKKISPSYALGSKEWQNHYQTMDSDFKTVFLNMPVKAVRKFIEPFVQSHIREDYYGIVEDFNEKQYFQGVLRAATEIKKEGV